MQKEQKHLSIGFNSTTVQLILLDELVRMFGCFKFQFHNGTINTFCRPIIRRAKLRFNSTTVQLIPRLTQEKSPINEFQFHNGTINTILVTLTKQGQLSFNSTTVQLIPSNDWSAKILLYVSIPQRYN